MLEGLLLKKLVNLIILIFKIPKQHIIFKLKTYIGNQTIIETNFNVFTKI